MASQYEHGLFEAFIRSQDAQAKALAAIAKAIDRLAASQRGTVVTITDAAVSDPDRGAR